MERIKNSSTGMPEEEFSKQQEEKQEAKLNNEEVIVYYPNYLEVERQGRKSFIE